MANEQYLKYLQMLGQPKKTVEQEVEGFVNEPNASVQQPLDPFMEYLKRQPQAPASPIAIAPQEIPETNASVNRAPAVMPSNDLDPADAQALPDSVDMSQAPRPQEPDLQSELKAAQDQSARDRAMANLQGAADFTARSINGNQQNPAAAAMFKSIADEADAPLKNFQQKMQVQDKEIARREDDPNSDISALYRDAIQKALPGQDMSKFANLSASQAAKIFPSLKGLLNDPSKLTEYQKRQLELEQERNDIARDKLDVKGEGATDGEKAIDKDYGKQYNEFTRTGITSSASGIERLKALAKELRDSAGPLELGGGRTSALNDAFRSRTAIERRDTAYNEANKTLKALFPGAISNAEREAAAKAFYNDALGNKENADILDNKVKELEDARANEIAKAKYFEKNRTLAGFGGVTNAVLSEGQNAPTVGNTSASKAPASTPDKSAPFPRQVKNSKTGQVATVSDEQELAEAQAEGFN